MRVVHARYSLENSVFSGVNIFLSLNISFDRALIRMRLVITSETAKGSVFRLTCPKIMALIIEMTMCYAPKKVYQVRNCHGFSDEDRTRIYHIAAMQLWWEKMGTFIMKSNSIYMNNAGDLLSGTLNRVHWQVLSADHYFGSGNALGFRVNNMSWNHGIDYWKYHVLCS